MTNITSKSNNKLLVTSSSQPKTNITLGHINSLVIGWFNQLLYTY